MEALYAKLYNKYDSLKKKKLSEMDEINKDQEVKFLNYMSAAEEVIQHLKEQNDRLLAQANDLRHELASIRSTKDEQFADYQKMLTEENEKNRKLSEEVEGLEKKLQEARDRKNETQLNVIETVKVRSVESTGSKRRMTRKRSQEMAEMETGMTTPGRTNQDNATIRELPEVSSKGTQASGDHSNFQQPECCKQTVDRAGISDLNNSSSTNCQFQTLIEYLTGMKLSSVNQTEEICISALHQSSGYSFSLTWVKNTIGEEPELLYNVLTLGTFERIAPEWMRSRMMFSMGMCPIFFERVTRAIKLYC